MSASGTLFLGSPRGVQAFSPEHLRDDPFPPPVVFTGLRIVNETVDPRSHPALGAPISRSDEIHLGPSDKVFTIDILKSKLPGPCHELLQTLFHSVDIGVHANGTGRNWISAKKYVMSLKIRLSRLEKKTGGDYPYKRVVRVLSHEHYPPDKLDTFLREKGVVPDDPELFIINRVMVEPDRGSQNMFEPYLL